MSIELPNKHTKIVATVGPASRNKEMLRDLIFAGANVFRLNFSHGSHEDHLKVIKMVQELNDELGTNICLLQDLQGPKIRTREIENGEVIINEGEEIIITTRELVGNSKIISTTYELLPNDVVAGNTILIDDGKLELKVTQVKGDEVTCKIIYGGVLKSRKGINLPDTKVTAPSLTEKDEEDLKFGLKHNIEWVALSFVRSAEDILYLKKKIEESGRNTKIIAKIEKPEALKNMESIIEVTDGVMVARGDLGVETPMETVPVMQKRLVRLCNTLGKPVIIATQMLESMIENPRPTRAETNDVANAVLDGADALMLSAESASGKYPVEAVSAMSRTIISVEENSVTLYNRFYEEESNSSTRLNDLLIRSGCRLSMTTQAKAFIGLTKSGYTANRIAMHRPNAAIYMFSSTKFILRQMNLVWGVQSFYYDEQKGIDETLEDLEKIMKKQGLLQSGDVYIAASSMPMHWKNHTNMIRIGTID